MAAGFLFIAIGGFFAIDSILFLRIGTTRAMGPGYFPLALGIILIVLGAAIALKGVNAPPEPFGRVPWRGGACVIAAVVLALIVLPTISRKREEVFAEARSASGLIYNDKAEFAHQKVTTRHSAQRRAAPVRGWALQRSESALYPSAPP